MSGRTDRDLITYHPFRPMPGRPDLCGHRDEPGDWPCGFGRTEHER